MSTLWSFFIRFQESLKKPEKIRDKELFDSLQAKLYFCQLLVGAGIALHREILSTYYLVTRFFTPKSHQIFYGPKAYNGLTYPKLPTNFSGRDLLEYKSLPF